MSDDAKISIDFTVLHVSGSGGQYNIVEKCVLYDNRSQPMKLNE